MSVLFPKSIAGNPIASTPYLHLVGNTSNYQNSATTNNVMLFPASFWGTASIYNTLTVNNATKTSVIIPSTGIYHVHFQTYRYSMPSASRYSVSFQTTNTSGAYANTSGIFANNWLCYGWNYVNGSTTSTVGPGPFVVWCTYNGLLIAGDEIWPTSSMVDKPSTASTYGYQSDPAFTYFDIQQTCRLV